MAKMQIVHIRGSELVSSTFAWNLTLFVIPESIKNMRLASNCWIMEYVGARHAEAGPFRQMETIR